MTARLGYFSRKKCKAGNGAANAPRGFLQNSCRKVTPHFPSVLEAVGNRFGRVVDTNRHSIDLRIDDFLRERIAGKSHEAQLPAIDNGFFALRSIAIQL
jgi:hypothetical protein